MHIDQRAIMAFLSVLLALLLPGSAADAAPASTTAGGERTPAGVRAPASYCEDFARRQIGLADRLLGQANYSRAVKVLNSTADNCDRDFVREKLYEVMSEWYGAVRGNGPGPLRQFLGVLAAQDYLSAAQRARLERRVEGRVQTMIGGTFDGGEFEATYELCRTFSEYADETFETEYYCGTAADSVGAQGAAMSSFAWLLDNWNEEQSLATWEEVAGTLESLYLLNGRFRASYELARRKAERTSSPDAILSSLIAARGNFLAPLLRVGAIFYDQTPGEEALSHVDAEMQRVGFPKYVRAFYVLEEDGSVDRGMYGSEANAPSGALLEKASGEVSLLRSAGDSNLAWLVSPVNSRYLILEFGVATTPEENVRLESIQETIESDEQWRKLYQLEYTETYPATGSAIGTFLGGALIANAGFTAYDEIFDDSSVLSYYSVQNGSAGIEESFDFDRSRLGYGGDEWERTSTTPALYHHAVEYAGQSMREVVWPHFVDDEWAGVVRIGLVQS